MLEKQDELLNSYKVEVNEAIELSIQDTILLYEDKNKQIKLELFGWQIGAISCATLLVGGLVYTIVK